MNVFIMFQFLILKIAMRFLLSSISNLSGWSFGLYSYFKVLKIYLNLLNLFLFFFVFDNAKICDVSESETSVSCFYVSPLWQIIALYVL